MKHTFGKVSDSNNKIILSSDLVAENDQIGISLSVSLSNMDASDSNAKLNVDQITSIEPKVLFIIGTTSIADDSALIVSFSSIDFIFSTEKTPFFSVFSIEYGTFTLASCSFQRGSTLPSQPPQTSLLQKKNEEEVKLTYSVIEIKGGVTEIVGCIFKGIHKNKDIEDDIVKGAAINAVLNEGKKLTIKGSEFDDCLSIDGYGGAIYLKLTGISSKLLITESDFGGDGINNDAQYGFDIFVEGGSKKTDDSLDKIITKSRFEAFQNIRPMYPDKAVGIDNEYTSPISFRDMILITSCYRYFSNEGDESKIDCQDVDDPCRYLSQSNINTSPSYTFYIFLDCHISKVDIIYLDGTIKPFKQQKNTLTIDSEGYFQVTQRCNSCFSDFIFHITSLSQNLFTITSGTVLFDSCSFESESSLEHSLCLIKSNGLLKFDNVKIEFESSLSISSSLIKIEGGGSAEINKMSVKNVELTGTDASVDGYNGSAISANIISSKSLIISNSSFDTCGVNGGCGGAVYVETVQGTLKIGGDYSKLCTFHNCYAEELDALPDLVPRGGAIFVRISDGTTLELKNIDFIYEKTNNAQYGFDIYLVYTDLKNILNDLKEDESGTNGGIYYEGSDHNSALGLTDDKDKIYDDIPLVFVSYDEYPSDAFVS